MGYRGAHYTLIGYYYNANVKDSEKKPIDFNMGAFIYEYETEQELEVIGNIYEHPELLSRSDG